MLWVDFNQIKPETDQNGNQIAQYSHIYVHSFILDLTVKTEV